MFDTVLLAIDHSPQTTETVAVGLQLARQHSSRVVLLSVVEEEGTMHDPVAVTQLLEQARSRFEQAGVPCDVFERQGKPAFVIGDVADEINAPAAPYRRFRGVMPGWDNTARRGTAANIFVNGSPQAYEVWLRGIVDATKRDLPPGERFLFINAWNEWAEGAHLEPDRKHGHGFLEATRRVVASTRARNRP
jgi:hypothetical protein